MKLVAVAMLVACSAPSNGDDVVGPFTGATHRFVVDRITVPRDAAEAGAFAADLDGDDRLDNKFGYATAVLATTNDLSPHGSEMIASGAIASFVEIQTDDLVTDATVGVRYYGSTLVDAEVVGGTFAGGAFASNRTRTTHHPGAAHVYLPVFVNADPVVVRVDGLELDLAPDGSGGYDGIVRGGIREAMAREAAHAGLVQMFETEPERHLVFMRGIDEDRDGVVSYAELEVSVIGLLVAADIDLFDSGSADSVSIAFGIHLSPCADGGCVTSSPQDACRNRVRDGYETDVDCGGLCQPCAAAKQCVAPADCQSQACDAGSCRAASCGDGVRDGYESDVDCGDICPACAPGQACAADRDCASGSCDNRVNVGVCS